MTTDWFRNTTWNKSVEQAFEEKLRRAKKNEQYLRIQACTLARIRRSRSSSWTGTLELPDNFDHAPAHVDRAIALLALGRVNDAIASYEAVLAREAPFPSLQTHAYLDLPYLIATCETRERYAQALQLLQAYEARLVFPVDRFRCTRRVRCSQQIHRNLRLLGYMLSARPRNGSS